METSKYTGIRALDLGVYCPVLGLFERCQTGLFSKPGKIAVGEAARRHAEHAEIRCDSHNFLFF
jgi:hypothetical protein